MVLGAVGAVGRTLLLLFFPGTRNTRRCCLWDNRVRQEHFEAMNPRLEQCLALLDPMGSTVPNFLPKRHHGLSRFVPPTVFL